MSEGVILVTTPQSASIQVTKRGAIMYKKLSVPIIGIVENMSSVTCPSCSTQIKIFGDGTLKLSKEIGASILQTFPLREEISTYTNKGVPIVVGSPDSQETESFLNLSKQIVNYLEQNKTRSVM